MQAGRYRLQKGRSDRQTLAGQGSRSTERSRRIDLQSWILGRERHLELVAVLRWIELT